MLTRARRRGIASERARKLSELEMFRDLPQVLRGYAGLFLLRGEVRKKLLRLALMG